MPVKIGLTADGMWAWIAQNQAAVRADKVKAAMRKAQKQAISEWTKLTGGEVGLPLRFQPEAFGILGLSERSPGYMRQQQRTIGGIYPYVAPIWLGKKDKKGALLTSPLSPSGTMRRLVLGGGYSITNKNSGGDTVTTLFSVTGAKILNRLADPWRTRYTREFLALDRGGRRDAAWIISRSNSLTREFLLREFASARKVHLRTQAEGQNAASDGAA